jgi:hypothetical protein
MVRPKGGRSQPRYYHLKEAGEQRLVAHLNGKQIRGERQPKPQPLSAVDRMIANLYASEAQAQALIERVQLQLMVSALMSPVYPTP